VNQWVKKNNELPLTWISLAFTSLMSFAMIPAESPRFELSGYLVFGIIFTAIFGSALAIWIQLRYQPRMSVTTAAVIYSFEPLFAALAAYLIQDHIPSTVTLYGAAFILAGMILSSLSRQKDIVPA
jgi:drug/metabolite transporter (DMT)-like permease